jgi:hypothetical protein
MLLPNLYPAFSSIETRHHWILYKKMVGTIFILGASFSSFSQQLHIGSGANLVMKGNSYLVVNNASVKNDGTFNTDTGTVKFTGAADTTISYISGSNPVSLKNLTIDKTSYGLVLKTTVFVKDTLKITQGILYSRDTLVLRSDASKTASVAALPVDGSGVATAYISGKLSIERYIKAHRAWRLLSAPIKTTNAPTINASWQEGVTTASGNPNPNPNYGIHIIGGTVDNGYDQGLTSNPSVKFYNNATNSFVGLPSSPGTNTPISNYGGYFAFVWGNRSTNISVSSTPATPTTLRMKGEMKTGKQTIPVNAHYYTVLGNPYPSAIDFGAIDKSDNVKNRFYAWDPMLAGAYGVGGYVTVSWNGSAYDVTGNVSSISQCIPSGAAILVQSNDSATTGQIVIEESDKTYCATQGVFARNGLDERLSSILYESNADGSKAMVDAVLTTFADENLNEIDGNDAPKIGSNYLGLKRNNALFAIERRKTITASDTLFLNISGLSIRNYQLNLVLSNMDTYGLQAILKDNYSATLNNLPLNMNDSNAIEFQVNSTPASYAANRFSVVFSLLGPLPVLFTNVQAIKKTDGILVKWDVENELNIDEYILEKSINGINFYPIITRLATAANGGSASYDYLDEAVVKGTNFYRVHSVSTTSTNDYSRIVKVNIASDITGNRIIVFPNPIEGNTINLQMSDPAKGIYLFRLLSSNGQTVYSERVQINSNLQNISLNIKHSLSAGVYQLEIKRPDQTTIIKKIIVQ